MLSMLTEWFLLLTNGLLDVHHVIELDKDIYGPDNHLVEWHRTPTTNETDGFQVLGIAAETRPKIIEALWQYIKTHKLQVLSVVPLVSRYKA
ncbi:hypothetical protein ANCDUO_01932 [Ancylostoma duodenale]|uniref:DM2 domain-containing protein n=1 Tax=Ancylostoma duodenale TaxID=51022 RepID=A0A0C2DXP5_9BILA|nr:hypothetical protein ANCDUO_01932 [Ancylostoma duodenale]